MQQIKIAAAITALLISFTGCMYQEETSPDMSLAEYELAESDIKKESGIQIASEEDAKKYVESNLSLLELPNTEHYGIGVDAFREDWKPVANSCYRMHLTYDGVEILGDTVYLMIFSDGVVLSVGGKPRQDAIFEVIKGSLTPEKSLLQFYKNYPDTKELFEFEGAYYVDRGYPQISYLYQYKNGDSHIRLNSKTGELHDRWEDAMYHEYSA